MRLARVVHENQVWLGRVDNDRVHLLRQESDHPHADVVIETFGNLESAVSDAVVQLADVRLLAPLRRPSKIVAIGLNYADHARESGAKKPERPLVFAKMPSSLLDPGADIAFSTDDSQQVDYEAELAVVIGRPARGELRDPLSHVLGYTICNDISARDAQFTDGQWVRGKSFDTFCPLGPWIVTPDEIPDVQKLSIGCAINGEKLQNGNTADMIFPVAELISYLARFMTLQTGDVIATGTPDGVGFARTPARYLRDQDQIEVWVEGIGSLTNGVTVT